MDIKSFASSMAPVADKPAPAPAPVARKEAIETLNAAAVAALEESAAVKAAISEEQLDNAVSSINTVLNVRSQELEFTVDKDSDRTIVTVIDKDTKEVIRQMPSREALEIAKALDRLQSLLTKQTA